MTKAANHNAKPAQPRAYALEPEGAGFRLVGDGKGMMTPAGKEFLLPTKPLGEAIVAEWKAQGSKINPDTMPLTQLAATALDVIAKDRKTIIDQISAYAETDLLYHRADEPPVLMEKQQKVWQPLLDWCALHYVAPLSAGAGLMPVKQPPESLANLRKVVEAHDDFGLTGLRQAVDVGGSLVLGLALATGHLSPEQVFEAAELDHSFQMEKWGEDPASAARRKGVRHDLEVCGNWFKLLRV